MFSPVSEVLKPRLLLATAFLLNLSGIFGMTGGVLGLTEDPILTAPDLHALPEDPSEWSEDERESHLFESTMYVLTASQDRRRAFAAANIVVSALLLIGGLFLSRNRPTALWWIRQAVLANILWVVGRTYTATRSLNEQAERFIAIAEPSLRWLPGPDGAPLPFADTGRAFILNVSGSLILGGGIQILVLLGLGFAAHRALGSRISPGA